MADLHTTVRMSGIVLGSLMFQQFNRDSDAEGFILGETKAEERSDITDSQMNHVQYEHTIHIQKHLSFQKLSSFYDNAGDVKRVEIERILSSDKVESVVGWYRQRRNTEQRMTFKEQVVHRNLQRALRNHELVFLLLTSTEVTSAGSTHRLDYTVFKSHGSRYHSIPLLLSNLGTLEHQDYRRVPVSVSRPSSGYTRAVKKHRSKFFTSSGALKEVNEVNNLNDTLQMELKAACDDVEQSERSLERLLADVSALRQAVAEKKAQPAQCQSTTLQKVKEQPDSHTSQGNMLLCAAMMELFPESPLLRTQVLSQHGAPLLEFSCNTNHGIDISTTLPLILAQRDARARGRGLGECDTFWAKRQHPQEVAHSTKIKRSAVLDTDSEAALTFSGSETEEELVVSQSESLQRSGSPVF